MTALLVGVGILNNRPSTVLLLRKSELWRSGIRGGAANQNF